jgi:hypothetical protein
VPSWQNSSSGANGVSAPHIAKSCLSISPFSQVLSPFASVVGVAGVIILHSPHSSLGIFRVPSVIDGSLTQVFVSMPMPDVSGVSQVGVFVSTQLQATQALSLLELLPLDEDEKSSLLLLLPDEDEPSGLLLLMPEGEEPPPPPPDDDIAATSGGGLLSSPPDEQEKMKAKASPKAATNASL